MTATSLADTLNLTDIGVTIDNHVAVVEIQKGPNNFFDTKMINDLADAFAAMDKTDEVRAIVLCSQGKHFCAGNDFSSAERNEERADRDPNAGNPLYAAAAPSISPSARELLAAAASGAGGARRDPATQWRPLPRRTPNARPSSRTARRRCSPRGARRSASTSARC